MSRVSKQDVERIAKLARIGVNDSEKVKLAEQLAAIVDWVKVLDGVNTDGVESMTNVHEVSMMIAEDKVLDGNLTKEVLANATDSKYNYYTVPKVIE